MKEKKNISEAYRYMRNADKLLKNTKVTNYGCYIDSKYVKMAGDTMWKGVLMALDPLHPPLGKGKRKSVDTYRQIFAKAHQKYQKIFMNAYSELHLAMGYDGNTSTAMKKDGWKNAKIIIEWAAKKT